jgi:hypothetical protein
MQNLIKCNILGSCISGSFSMTVKSTLDTGSFGVLLSVNTIGKKSSGKIMLSDVELDAELD